MLPRPVSDSTACAISSATNSDAAPNRLLNAIGSSCQDHPRAVKPADGGSLRVLSWTGLRPVLIRGCNHRVLISKPCLTCIHVEIQKQPITYHSKGLWITVRRIVVGHDIGAITTIRRNVSLRVCKKRLSIAVTGKRPLRPTPTPCSLAYFPVRPCH